MANFDLYNARGNKYFVATPGQIREAGVDLPDNPAQAAAEGVKRGSWTHKISKHVSGGDGLLVGPFTAAGGIGLLIVNTGKGGLAERSGNGLTIFAKYLVAEHKELVGSDAFVVNVYHPRTGAIPVPIQPDIRDGRRGFWVDMDVAEFGHQEVGALEDYGENRSPFSRVSVLEKIDPTWVRSKFVSIGNPHCVTFLDSEAAVRSVEEREDEFRDRLEKIADDFEYGGDPRPFPKGINLQWAFVAGNDGRGSAMIHARVFERGEGWTDSSGSSATAVASAAREVGFVSDEVVLVKMKDADPLVIRFDDRSRHVYYFGVATKVDRRDDPHIT
jgi:diaminopimelate epimerase